MNLFHTSVTDTEGDDVPGRWERIVCTLSNAWRYREDVSPHSSITNESYIYTSWALNGSNIPLFEDHRWPCPNCVRPDAQPCEHYRFVPDDPTLDPFLLIERRFENEEI